MTMTPAQADRVNKQRLEVARKNRQRKDMTAQNMIYDLFNKSDNLETFREQLQEMFDTNPIGFYLKFVAPIQPKQIPLFIGDEVTEATSQEEETNLDGLDLSKLSPEELRQLKDIVDKAKQSNRIIDVQ